MLEYQVAYDIWNRLQTVFAARCEENVNAHEFYEEFLHSAVDYAAIRTNWSFMTVAERLNQDHYRTVHHDAFIARLQAVCRICGITELEELMPDRKTKGDFASYITAFLGISQR